MSNYVFSPSLNTFFATKYQSDYQARGAWPQDGVAVDDSTFQKFACQTPPEGMTRGVGSGGMPVWIAAPSPTSAQLADQVRAQRDGLMNQCDWVVQRHRDQIDTGIPTTLTTAQFQAWTTYRQSLRDVTKQSGFPVTVTWPTAPAAPSAPQV
jgi:hypothetical protein